MFRNRTIKFCRKMDSLKSSNYEDDQRLSVRVELENVHWTKILWPKDGASLIN